MITDNFSLILFGLFGLFFLIIGIHQMTADPDELFRKAQRGARWRFGVDGGRPTPDFARRVRSGAIACLVIAVLMFGLGFALRGATASSDVTLGTPSVFMTPTPTNP